MNANALTKPGQPDLRAILRAELSDGQWIEPPSTPALVAQAKAVLADYGKRMEPAGHDAKQQWLEQLGVLCAGRMTADEARLKTTGYASLLDHEAGCFTRSSLKLLASKFSWFPSFAEVKAELDQVRRRLHQDRHRLRLLAAGDKPKEGEGERRWRDLTDAEREAHQARMRDLLAGITGSFKREPEAFDQPSQEAANVEEVAQ